MVSGIDTRTGIIIVKVIFVSAPESVIGYVSCGHSFGNYSNFVIIAVCVPVIECVLIASGIGNLIYGTTKKYVSLSNGIFSDGSVNIDRTAAQIPRYRIGIALVVHIQHGFVIAAYKFALIIACMRALCSVCQFAGERKARGIGVSAVNLAAYRCVFNYLSGNADSFQRFCNVRRIQCFLYTFFSRNAVTCRFVNMEHGIAAVRRRHVVDIYALISRDIVDCSSIVLYRTAKVGVLRLIVMHRVSRRILPVLCRIAAD